MGVHYVEQELDERKLQEFTQALLADLRALAFMLEHGCIESGMHRIGAEQEMFIVDRNLRPAPLALEILERAGDNRLTTEMARFNLEANLTPLELTGRCFHLMHEELKEVLTKAGLAATELEADILLAGILPTLKVSDLTLANLTPMPRYHELNRSVTQLRGGPFSIQIKGLDELQLTHDRPGVGGGCQLPTSVWTPFMARDPPGTLPTFGRRPLANPARAQPTNPGRLWRKMAKAFRHRVSA